TIGGLVSRVPRGSRYLPSVFISENSATGLLAWATGLTPWDVCPIVVLPSRSNLTIAGPRGSSNVQLLSRYCSNCDSWPPPETEGRREGRKGCEQTFEG